MFGLAGASCLYLLLRVRARAYDRAVALGADIFPEFPTYGRQALLHAYAKLAQRQAVG